MSYKYFPPSKKPAKPRPCGFTRPELSELRALSHRGRPHNVRTWLHETVNGFLAPDWLRHRYEAALIRTASAWTKAHSPEPKKVKGAKKRPIAFRSMAVCSRPVSSYRLAY